jgi:hypothetical protein
LFWRAYSAIGDAKTKLLRVCSPSKTVAQVVHLNPAPAVFSGTKCVRERSNSRHGPCNVWKDGRKTEGHRPEFFSFPAGATRTKEFITNIAFLAVTAAGLAGLSGWGINAQTSPVQTAQVVNNAPDYSQQAGVFSQWLDPQAPQCVAVSAIISVSHLTTLTHEQFQFVRALYVAIPPISRRFRQERAL